MIYGSVPDQHFAIPIVSLPVPALFPGMLRSKGLNLAPHSQSSGPLQEANQQ